MSSIEVFFFLNTLFSNGPLFSNGSEPFEKKILDWHGYFDRDTDDGADEEDDQLDLLLYRLSEKDGTDFPVLLENQNIIGNRVSSTGRNGNCTDGVKMTKSKVMSSC